MDVLKTRKKKKIQLANGRRRNDFPYLNKKRSQEKKEQYPKEEEPTSNKLPYYIHNK